MPCQQQLKRFLSVSDEETLQQLAIVDVVGRRRAGHAADVP